MLRVSAPVIRCPQLYVPPRKAAQKGQHWEKGTYCTATTGGFPGGGGQMILKKVGLNSLRLPSSFYLRFTAIEAIVSLSKSKGYYLFDVKTRQTKQ